jgi:hypothetical protein
MVVENLALANARVMRRRKARADAIAAYERALSEGAVERTCETYRRAHPRIAQEVLGRVVSAIVQRLPLK